MKNVCKLALCFLAISAVILTSCCTKTAEARLDLEVKAFNKTCPLKLATGEIIESASLDKTSRQMSVIYLVNDDAALEILNASPDASKQILLTAFSGSKEGRKLIELISEADYSLKIVYKPVKLTNSSKSVEVFLTNEELKNALGDKTESTDNSTLQQLQIMVDITNQMTPNQIDESTILLSMKIEGERVVYDYEVDEDNVAISDIKANRASMRDNISKQLQANESTKQMLDLINELDYKLIYRYKGNKTGDMVEIEI